MGHLSNPIGLRLGLNRAWPTKGGTDFYHNNAELFSFLHILCLGIFGTRKFQRMGIIFSHISFRSKNLSIFLYDSRLESFYLDHVYKFTKKLNRRSFLSRKTLKSYSSPFFLRKRTILVENAFRKHAIKIRQPLFSSLLVKLQQILLTMLNKKYTNTPSFTLKIHPLGNRSLTAKVLGVYAIRKLKANNILGRIIGPIIKGMRRYLKGLRFYCAGRFTRKQRASFRVFWFGKITLNKFSQPVDYCFTSIPLKFGVGSIKIWLTWKDRLDYEN